jgi:hypothetical protein
MGIYDLPSLSATVPAAFTIYIGTLVIYRFTSGLFEPVGRASKISFVGIQVIDSKISSVNLLQISPIFSFIIPFVT